METALEESKTPEQIRKERDILYGLFRDHMELQGSLHATEIALAALLKSLRLFTPEEPEDFDRQLGQLYDAIWSSEPRITPLISMLSICDADAKTNALTDAREKMIACIQGRLNYVNESVERVAEAGAHLVEDGDFIVVHSVSIILKRLLGKAKERGKSFKVLILKQDMNKTGQVMRQLREEGVDYRAAPEYSVAHFMDQATKMFLGAMAITEDDKAVCSVGTASIVGMAHLNNLPVYLFVSPLALSDKVCGDHNIHRKEEVCVDSGLEYTQIIHSNDVVDICMMNHLVGEDGEMDESWRERFACRI
ncbi:MAG: hypothetical protein ACLFRG_16780 [Desulfococcaceae bacterium]